jgi:hypothetical protein
MMIKVLKRMNRQELAGLFNLLGQKLLGVESVQREDETSRSGRTNRSIYFLSMHCKLKLALRNFMNRLFIYFFSQRRKRR